MSYVANHVCEWILAQRVQHLERTVSQAAQQIVQRVLLILILALALALARGWRGCGGC